MRHVDAPGGGLGAQLRSHHVGTTADQIDREIRRQPEGFDALSARDRNVEPPIGALAEHGSDAVARHEDLRVERIDIGLRRGHGGGGLIALAARVEAVGDALRFLRLAVAVRLFNVAAAASRSAETRSEVAVSLRHRGRQRQSRLRRVGAGGFAVGHGGGERRAVLAEQVEIVRAVESDLAGVFKSFGQQLR